MSRSLILGTAGHIDHGKTALVRALTGTDTDRLAEEKRRGITIELGFARLELDDTEFGIVDVPGHERFIKSMVAGAGGIDLVMLVIAADEGVMPQTREHLDICQLLGVEHGIVALAKADLVDEEWLELVREDVRETLRGTFVEQAPMIACSAVDRRGLEPLCTALREQAEAIPPRDPDDRLRLPLDRVFTIRGFGTVVTGTLLSGTIRTGDHVDVLPSGAAAVVRRIEVHGQQRSAAIPGQRTAINLAGVERQAVARGEVVAHRDTLVPSSIVDVQLSLLSSARRGLSRHSRVLFHLGTRQQQTACTLLDRPRVEPGQQAIAQLRFEQPVVALPGDRFILRGFSKQENYGTTIGGGEIIRVLSPRVRPRQREAVARLQALAKAGPSERTALEVAAQGERGLDRRGLQQRLALAPSALDAALERLLADGELIAFANTAARDRELAVVHRDVAAAVERRLVETVDQFHRDQPLAAGIPRAELRSRAAAHAPARLFAHLLTQLEDRGELVSEEDYCRRPDHGQRPAVEVDPLAHRIAEIYRAAGLAPPRLAEVAAQLAIGERELAPVVDRLVRDGALVKVAALIFAAEHVAELGQRLRALLEQRGEISAAEFKQLVGQSRKYVIPLAEYFDAQRLTIRIGDARRLRR